MIGAQLRYPPGKFDGCGIEVGEPAFGVRGVNRGGKGIDHVAEFPLGGFDLLIRALMGSMSIPHEIIDGSKEVLRNPGFLDESLRAYIHRGLFE